MSYYDDCRAADQYNADTADCVERERYQIDLEPPELRRYWVEVTDQDGKEWGFAVDAYDRAAAETDAMRTATESPWFIPVASATAHLEEL